MWQDKIVCQHKLSEKCHTTFLTDYRPTQERKCHTSYNKKCRITYKPSVSPSLELESTEREFIIYTVIYQYVGEIVKGGLDYVENIIVHFKNIL